MKPKRTDRSESRAEDPIEFARSQRTFSNEFAANMWQQLRNRRCEGMKFRREFPIPPYTVDFCCVELKLIVEIDGKDHLTSQGQSHDQRRDKFLAQQGFRVIRIPGYQVLKNLSKVMEIVQQAIQDKREKKDGDASKN
jgi:very-short-patch-repair endonuclease